MTYDNNGLSLISVITISWFSFILLFGEFPNINTMETIGTEELASTINSKNQDDPLNAGFDDISNLTLEQFCQQYNISYIVCTCQFLGDICSLLNNTNSSSNIESVVVQIYTCNDELSLTIIILVSSSIGIFGNLLVIIVTYSNWKNITSWCHKLIGALAVCDFTFAVLDFAQTVPNVWTCGGTFYEEIMCKMFAFTINAVATLGLGFILIVAVERYIGICFPFTRGLTSKVISLMILINFGFSLLINIPLMVVTEKNEFLTCFESWSNEIFPKIYSWLMLIFSFLLPVMAISLMYSKIIYTIRKSQRDILSVSATVVGLENKRYAKRNKEHQRIMFILISVLVAFVLLVSPDKFIWALKDQGLLKNVSREAKQLLNFCTRIPLSLHGAINPIIYSVVDKRFRGSLKMLVFKLLAIKKSARGGAVTIRETSFVDK